MRQGRFKIQICSYNQIYKHCYALIAFLLSVRSKCKTKQVTVFPTESNKESDRKFGLTSRSHLPARRLRICCSRNGWINTNLKAPYQFNIASSSRWWKDIHRLHSRFCFPLYRWVTRSACSSQRHSPNKPNDSVVRMYPDSCITQTIQYQ